MNSNEFEIERVEQDTSAYIVNGEKIEIPIKKGYCLIYRGESPLSKALEIVLKIYGESQISPATDFPQLSVIINYGDVASYAFITDSSFLLNFPLKGLDQDYSFEEMLELIKGAIC